MSLEPIRELMQHALQKSYAIGYFESWNLESLQGVIDAAEETRSPIIIGFSGELLSRPGRRTAERLSWYAALGRTAAESASVPCGLIFNECNQDDWNRKATKLGFNLIQIPDSEGADTDYVRRVAEFTKYAHANGVAVEAEVGRLACGITGQVDDSGALTDPKHAAQFVEMTGVDLLAVSAGNVHNLVQGELGLDLGRLADIRRRVSIPLVLHGGTGIAGDALPKAISLGVAKVNYGTYLKQRYLKAVRAALDCDEPNPHKLLGYGGPEDVMVAGCLAVRAAVLERIRLLGCCGMA